MTIFQVIRATGTLMAAIVLVGCASNHTVVQDRTPSWMKYQVTGSRIARRTDGQGKPISADIVRSTSAGGLSTLPSVTMDHGR